MAVVLYADGSCTKNGQKGARAGIGIYNAPGSKYNLSEPWSSELGSQTNQRAELMAGIRALERTAGLALGSPLEIRSDSEYLIKGMTEWMPQWKKNGWHSSTKKPVKNKELWLKLDVLATSHPAKITWTHVRGHANVAGNEEADKAATRASARTEEEEPPAKRAKTT
jgi:ribonuclease HI